MRKCYLCGWSKDCQVSNLQCQKYLVPICFDCLRPKPRRTAHFGGDHLTDEAIARSTERLKEMELDAQR